MVSFPRAVVGAVVIGILDRVLFFNYTADTGLVQFVLFVVVLVLVARVSRNDSGSSGESFQFAPRIAAMPERLRNIWWVRRLPQFVARPGVAGRGDPADAERQVGAAPDVGDDHRASRSARSRWWCSPAGVASSRSARWRSPASARSPPPR